MNLDKMKNNPAASLFKYTKFGIGLFGIKTVFPVTINPDFPSLQRYGSSAGFHKETEVIYYY